MGRTLDILKHRHAAIPSAKVDPQPQSISLSPALPSMEQSEEIPFVEVGGPNHSLLGSSTVLAKANRAPKTVVSNAKVGDPGLSKDSAPAHDRPTSNESNPLSVVFYPLGSLHSIETATGVIASDLAVYHQPDSAASHQYREVANGIHQQLAAGGTHVLLFTGVSARAGTTTTVLNLAMIWSKQEKRKVLVVDASEARAAAAVKLGLSNTPGLTDVLRGTVPWQQALQETKQANCWILAAGESAFEPNSAHQPQPMRDLLRHARKQFDLILLDALPWNEESVTLTMASGADAVYLVNRQADAKAPRVNDIITRVQRHDIFLGGCVITHRDRD